MTDAQEQPKRRLPRFSLITLIVAVNVAGVLVWANVRERDLSTVDIPAVLDDEGIYGPRITNFPALEILIFNWFRGWPKIAVLANDIDWRIKYSNLCVNLATAVGIVLVSALVTEFLARKLRNAKRHDG